MLQFPNYKRNKINANSMKYFSRESLVQNYLSKVEEITNFLKNNGAKIENSKLS